MGWKTGKRLLTRNREGGFSLMEVMIAAGTLGIVSAGVMSVNMMGLKGSSNNMITFQADSFRRMLSGLLQNDQAWKRTVDYGPNATFACIRNNTDCAGAGGTFAILNAQGTVIYNPGPANNGFDINGATCNTFNPAGNDRCPFRTTYAWTAVCPPSGACINPQVSITGITQFRPSATNSMRKVPFNEASYGISLVRNASPTTLGTGSGYYLAKWFTNSTIGSSGVFEANGSADIGIGNANPQAKLDVTGQIRMTGGGPAPGRILSTPDGSGLFSWIDLPVTWLRNGSSLYYNDGSVGVGTASPAYRFHVIGSAGFDDITVGNNGSFGSINVGNLTVGNAANLNSLTTNSITTSSITTNSFRMPAGAGPGLALLSDAGGNASWQPLPSPPQLWQQNGSSIYYNAGRVGVLTAAPQADLHVRGTIMGRFVCREVSAQGTAAGNTAIANCAANEFLLNGGGECSMSSPTTIALLHANRPFGNGWLADCVVPFEASDPQATAYATCCRNGD
jgi:type II secretory pathway pseudopilin PulG